MTAYYNEIDPFAAQWLRELIKGNHIAPGDVDERSIEDVTPNDLREYTQCHFFAGIGVWSYALRQAGWPDNSPVWTGSCPCQPFSQAGQGKGFDDHRHLWPSWYWLIQQCRPEFVFGEQVAGKAGETWFDLVSTDVEGAGYTIGAVVMSACGVGAPHQRKRLYFVAKGLGVANCTRLQQREQRPASMGHRYPFVAGGGNGRMAQSAPKQLDRCRDSREGWWNEHSDSGADGELGHSDLQHQSPARSHAKGTRDDLRASEACHMADTESSGHGEHQRDARTVGHTSSESESEKPETRRTAQVFGDNRKINGMADTQHHARGSEQSERKAQRGTVDGWMCPDGIMADTDDRPNDQQKGSISQTHPGTEPRRTEFRATGCSDVDRPGPTNGHWRDVDWLFCRDGNWRAVKPGTFPLVNGTARELVYNRNLRGSYTEKTKEARAARLKGYGNAIVAPQAQAIIEVVMRWNVTVMIERGAT